MKSFVYITTNLINGKKYIGSSTENRHGSSTYLGSGVLLKHAVKKYGRNNFTRQILWSGDNKFKNDMEEYYIYYYNASKNDLFYNISEKGKGIPFGTKLSDKINYQERNNKIDFKKRSKEMDWDIIAQKHYKSILQLDKQNNLIKEWDATILASQQLNIHPSNITACLKERLKTAGGYIWKYKQPIN